MTQQPFDVRVDRRLIRAVHHSTRYALLEIVAPPATGTMTRPRVNVAFVLDRSGSMGGDDKFGLAKSAVIQGIERLAATDRFAVVVYDTEIDVIAAGRAADADAKRSAIRALDTVGPRGGTNLGEGWLRGAEQVASALDPEGVNRVLLLTDGLANEGMTEPAELGRHAAELRARGVSTSTFGVGDDFDERLLGVMADQGGGAFRDIRVPSRIPELIGSEVGELLEVTARDVRVRISGPDGLRVSSLASYRIEPTSTGAIVHVGDLVADQELRLVVGFGFPLGEVGREVGAELVLEERDGRLDGRTTLTWTYADGGANDAQARDREVDRAVARAYADRSLQEAVGLNRRGDFEGAGRLLAGVARRIRGYAAGDDLLRGIVAELERAAEEWSVDRLEVDRKLMYASAHYSLKSRSAMLGEVQRRTR